jgi:hypothetical protein
MERAVTHEATICHVGVHEKESRSSGLPFPTRTGLCGVQGTKNALNNHGRLTMKPLVVLGAILVILGIVALAIPGFTYFTTERVADVGFFKIDVQKPHTIVFNPIVGVAALIAGLALVVLSRRPSSR